MEFSFIPGIVAKAKTARFAGKFLENLLLECLAQVEIVADWTLGSLSKKPLP